MIEGFSQHNESLDPHPHLPRSQEKCVYQTVHDEPQYFHIENIVPITSSVVTLFGLINTHTLEGEGAGSPKILFLGYTHNRHWSPECGVIPNYNSS